MDFLGFEFAPEAIVMWLTGAWAMGAILGGIAAVLASVARRR